MVRCPLSICLCTPIQCARQHNPAPCPRGPQPRNDCRCCRPPCMALHPAWPGPQTPTPTGSRPDWLGKSEASDTPHLRQRAFLPPVELTHTNTPTNTLFTDAAQSRIAQRHHRWTLATQCATHVTPSLVYTPPLICLPSDTPHLRQLTATATRDAQDPARGLTRNRQYSHFATRLGTRRAGSCERDRR